MSEHHHEEAEDLSIYSERRQKRIRVTAWVTIGALADAGILAAPGSFYGTESGQHVRIALTATDEAIAEAARRLGSTL